MKKQAFFGICCLVLIFSPGLPGFADPPSAVHAARAQLLPHNTSLVLRGNIVFGLGGDRYLFRDSTGDMVLRINDEKWEGLYVGPFDRIEIDGELRRDDRIGLTEIHVINIRSAAGTLERGAAELEHLFIWPVSARITSPYGNRRSPVNGRRQFHSGIDISAPFGTPVRAAMSGRVSAVGRDRVYGNYIIISHHSGLRTKYAHLSSARVRAGDYIETGARIGDVGSTGISTGPHLHFTVFRNGVTVNPRSLLR